MQNRISQSFSNERSSESTLSGDAIVQVSSWDDLGLREKSDKKERER